MLGSLRACPLRARQAKHLDLTGCRITGAGLAHVRDLPKLSKLEMGDTQVTDAGLVHLTGLKELRKLQLRNTRVTTQAARKLWASLPHLKDQRFVDRPKW